MSEYINLLKQDLEGKTIVLRVDFNSPIEVAQEPRLADPTRIDDHLQTTIIPLIAAEHPPRNIVLLAHQGRRGDRDCVPLRLHFEHVRAALRKVSKTFYVGEEYDDADILQMGEDAISGTSVLDRIRRLGNRSVLLLENVRLSEFEDLPSDCNGTTFAEVPLIKMLRKLENIIVAFDGFSVAHRRQASVVGLGELGPVYAGPVVEREIEQLSRILNSPKLPIVLIVGGGKIDDSVQSVKRLLNARRIHKVLTGGLVGMAFLHVAGKRLNEATLCSLKDATEQLDPTLKCCRDLLSDFPDFIEMPTDVAYSTRFHRHNLRLNNADHNVNEEFTDIGVETIGRYIGLMANAKTIIMNGPLGRYKRLTTALGTKEILRYAALLAREGRVKTLIGGGDTCAALSGVENANAVTRSSSGKAILEVLASGSIDTLVGLKVLQSTKDRSITPGRTRRSTQTKFMGLEKVDGSSNTL